MAKAKKSGSPAPAVNPAPGSSTPAPKKGGMLESIADWAKAKIGWVIGIAIILIAIIIHFTGPTKHVTKKKDVSGSPSAQTSSPDETAQREVNNYALFQVIRPEVKEPPVTITWKDVEAPYGKWSPVYEKEIEGKHWEVNNNEDDVLICGNENPEKRIYRAVSRKDDKGLVVFDADHNQVYDHYISNEDGDLIQKIPGVPNDVSKVQFRALKKGGIKIRLGTGPLQ